MLALPVKEGMRMDTEQGRGHIAVDATDFLFVRLDDTDANSSNID